VSASLGRAGLPAAILDLASRKIILMCISAPIIAEYENVLRRTRLELDPWSGPRGPLAKPRTNPITASLNAPLPPAPKRFENIRIVTPMEFIESIAPELNQSKRWRPPRT